jgi:allantoinase
LKRSKVASVERGPAIGAWPRGAKLAVLVTVMFEAWPEGKSPPYSPMASPLRKGVTDLQGIAWARYGGTTGIWRILRLLDDAGIKATVCANAHALELYPDAAKEIVKRGHELAGHGYVQNEFMPYLTPKKEQETIRRCARIFEKIAGVRPTGWASPRMTPTEHTAAFLAEEGFRWHGDCHDSDLPYVVHTKKGALAMLPHSDYTDNRALRASLRDYHQVYVDTAELLLREPVAYLNVTMHTHVGGRPNMAAVIAETLAFLKSRPGAWFARHDEVANWTLDQAQAR